MLKSTSLPQYTVLRRHLISLRTEAQLSQRALAARLRVPHTWVAKVESGERRIDLIEFGLYCQNCGVSPNDAARVIFETVTLAKKTKGPFGVWK